VTPTDRTENGPPPEPSAAGREESGATITRRDEYGGVRLLASDVRTVFLLANEARYRTIERVLGVPREQANLASLIVLLVAAEAAQIRAERVMRSPSTPHFADFALGAAGLREVIYGIAGTDSRETPLFGTLALIAVLGGLATPIAEASASAIKTAYRDVRQVFGQRYGHLVRRGRREWQRASSRARAVRGAD
jgi:hypothetical protein